MYSIFFIFMLKYPHARVVKLVYTYALGAYAFGCAGSSPVAGTNIKSLHLEGFYID